MVKYLLLGGIGAILNLTPSKGKTVNILLLERGSASLGFVIGDENENEYGRGWIGQRFPFCVKRLKRGLGAARSLPTIPPNECSTRIVLLRTCSLSIQRHISAAAKSLPIPPENSLEFIILHSSRSINRSRFPRFRISSLGA